VVGKVRADAAVTGELPVYVRDTNSAGLGDLMPVIEGWATVHAQPVPSPANPLATAAAAPPTVVAEEEAADLPSFVREAAGHAITVLPLAVLAWLVLSRTWGGLGWVVVGALIAGGLFSWVRNRLLPPSWRRFSDGSLCLPSTRRSADLPKGGYSIRRGLLDRIRDSAWVVPAGGGRGRLIYGYRSLRRHDTAPESANGFDLVPSVAASIAVVATLLAQRWI
jgi:hypothetical protein